jgi:hypothetical protein
MGFTGNYGNYDRQDKVERVEFAEKVMNGEVAEYGKKPK